jgi:phosphatidylglycerol---prolipoprotein diacylglyceryl transferase
VYPDLLSFKFPAFVGAITWPEIGLTLALFALLELRASLRPGFRWQGFAIGAAIYAAIRAAIFFAGPGYPFSLHTYGVLIAVGFVVGIVLAVRQARREGVDPNLVLDLSFWILIAAIVGSRLVYVIVNAEEYLAHPLDLLKVWKGGLVFYGGFLGAVGVSWWYCRKRRVPFLRIADLMIPSVAIGHFFGRLGCFAAGCCHGCATGSASFGMALKAGGPLLHPTQLYEAFGELCFFVILLLRRRQKTYQGQLLVTWLLLYPVWRFATEMFRGDPERKLLFEVNFLGTDAPNLLSTSQLISLGLLLVGAILFWVLRNKRMKTGRREGA